jgi:site-specific DNA-methyltransferase (adenine-specific)
MKEIPSGSVDAVICDPPYGTTKCQWDVIIPFDLMWGELKRVVKPRGAIVLFGQEPFTSLLRCSNLEMFKYDWYWEKERLTNIHQVKRRAGKTVETITVFYENQCIYNPQMQLYTGVPRSNKVRDGRIGGLSDDAPKRVKEYKDNGTRYPTQVLKFKRDILTSNLHPTQKPIELMEYMVKTYTHEGDTVLDFTMGSGTTGVACKNLNRKFIGVEMDGGYFDIAKERILND